MKCNIVDCYFRLGTDCRFNKETDIHEEKKCLQNEGIRFVKFDINGQKRVATFVTLHDFQVFESVAKEEAISIEILSFMPQ